MKFLPEKKGRRKEETDDDDMMMRGVNLCWNVLAEEINTSW